MTRIYNDSILNFSFKKNVKVFLHNKQNNNSMSTFLLKKKQVFVENKKLEITFTSSLEFLKKIIF